MPGSHHCRGFRPRLELSSSTRRLACISFAKIDRRLTESRRGFESVLSTSESFTSSSFCEDLKRFVGAIFKRNDSTLHDMKMTLLSNLSCSEFAFSRVTRRRDALAGSYSRSKVGRLPYHVPVTIWS